jgi:hypothetical protein
MWIGTAFLTATASFAQSNAPRPDGRIGVALTYAADYAGVNTGQYNFWMQGGSVELSAGAYRGLGVVADVTGLHTASAGAGRPLNMVTIHLADSCQEIFRPQPHSLRTRPGRRSAWLR